MKKYLLDTDAVSIFYDAVRTPEHTRINSRVSALSAADELHVSVLTLFEFEYSYANASDPLKQKIRTTIEQMQATFMLVPLKQKYEELESLYPSLQTENWLK